MLNSHCLAFYKVCGRNHSSLKMEISRIVVRYLTEVRYMGETLHYEKASLMLCQLASWNLGNFKVASQGQCQKCMLWVCYKCVPECVARVFYILMHTFLVVRNIPAQADFYSFTSKGLRGPQGADGLDGCLRFFCFCSKPKLNINSLIGYLWAIILTRKNQ